MSDVLCSSVKKPTMIQRTGTYSSIAAGKRSTHFDESRQDTGKASDYQFNTTKKGNEGHLQLTSSLKVPINHSMLTHIGSFVNEAKTYNSGDSLVVTDPTTNPPLTSLTMGERTGSRIFW